MRIFALILCCTVLGGCQLLTENRVAYDRAHDIPVGSRLVLHKPLTVPANERHLYIQLGQVSSYWSLNQYYPYCKLDLHGLSKSARTVRADEFVVYKTGHNIDPTASRSSRLLASVGDVDDDGGPSPVLYATVLHLRSETQPEVSKLSCGKFMDPQEGDYPTIKEVREAMGSLFTLKLAVH